MIEGRTEPHPLIAIAQSTITFYPTGSRYFGDARPDSDWDFYTADTPETRFWLEANGFEQLPFNSLLAEYDDPNICSVYRHPEHVDVQLTNQLDARIRAHKRMKGLYAYQIYRAFDKSARKVLWHFIYYLD